MNRKFIFSFLFALSVSAAADARVVFLPQAAESIGNGNSATQKSNPEEESARKCTNSIYTMHRTHNASGLQGPACPSGFDELVCPWNSDYYNCVHEER